MKPELRAVSTELPEPPYPEDTKANGYRPEFDVDRIEDSETWILADDDVRPWLLMLWLAAWRSVPAGSYLNDHKLIAKKIRCEFEWFQIHREQLMRGWNLHADGRLYHPYISTMIIEMLDKRKKSADRVKKHREAKKIVDVTRYQRVSNAQEQEQEQDSSLRSEKELAFPSFDKSKDSKAGKISPQSDEISPEPEAVVNKKKTIKIPYQQIADAYHEILPELNGLVQLTQTRKAHIRSLYLDGLESVESWEKYFHRVRESKFLMGRANPSPNRKPFVATFDWLIKRSNVVKVYEGNYL